MERVNIKALVNKMKQIRVLDADASKLKNSSFKSDSRMQKYYNIDPKRKQIALESLRRSKDLLTQTDLSYSPTPNSDQLLLRRSLSEQGTVTERKMDTIKDIMTSWDEARKDTLAFMTSYKNTYSVTRSPTSPLLTSPKSLNIRKKKKLKRRKSRKVVFNLLNQMAVQTFLDLSRRNLQIPDLSPYISILNLDLSRNQIESTQEISRFYMLIELDLSFNRLAQLRNFSQLEQLKVIDISHNYITSLYALRNWYRIHTIIANHNELTRLEGLEGMSLLQYLDVSNNQLGNINNSVRFLALNTKLQVLKLHGNHLKNYKQACWSLIPSLAVIDSHITPPTNYHGTLARNASLKNSYAVIMNKKKGGLNSKASQRLMEYEKSVAPSQQMFCGRMSQMKSPPKPRPAIQRPTFDFNPGHYPILSTKNLDSHPLMKELKLGTPRGPIPSTKDIDLNVTDSPTNEDRVMNLTLTESHNYQAKDRDLNITDSPTPQLSDDDMSLHMSNLDSSNKDQVNMLSPGMMFGTYESNFNVALIESPIEKESSPQSTREQTSPNQQASSISIDASASSMNESKVIRDLKLALKKNRDLK